MEERLTVRIGADLKDFERKMSKMQGRMDKVGGKMSKIGGTFTKGSAAIVGGAAAAGAGLYAMTSKVTENADAIAKGSERMGVSTKAYQEMDFWASQNGLSQENMEKVVGRLNQRLGLAVDGNEKYASALERLGVDLKGVENGTVSTEDAMAQSIQTLSTMENENEKAALASELFGTKMSRELLPALNDGSLTMEDAKKKAQELGLVMSDDQLKAAEAFQDAQDQIKRSLGAVGMQIGLDLMPHFQRMHEWILDNLPQIRKTITGAFESVIGAVKSVVDWWQGLSDRMKTIIPIVAGVALAFGPVLLVVGKVIGVISGLVTVFTPVLAAITKAGGLLKWLAPLFGVLTSPITLTVAAIAALGAGFVLAYNKSETFRNFIDGLRDKFNQAVEWIGNFKDGILGLFEDDGMKGMDILESIGISEDMRNTLWDITGYFIEFYHQVKEQIEKVKGIFNGVMDMFQGDWTGGKALLEKVGLNEAQILAVENGVMKVRRFFHDMKEGISNALSGVKDFFIRQFEGIRSWWDQDGKMILDAISSVFESTFDIIREVAKVGLDFVKNLFQTFAPIVSGIWSVLWPTVVTVAKNAWETIKLVIGTAMDIVKGIISLVSAAIEGDWSRFGEVLKETAGSIKDRVVQFFGNLRDNSLELFDKLTGGAVTKFTELKDGAINRVTEMYNSVTGWFSDLWTYLRNKVKDIKVGTVRRFKDMKDGVIDGVTSLYNGATDLFQDVKDYASDTFDDMVDGAKSLPGRIGDAIKGAASFAVDGVKSLGNKMASSLENVVNSVVDGLNSLLEKIGLDDLLPTISIPRFSRGTGGGNVPTFSTGTANGRLTSDTLGILNDRGPGNGRGGATQELIQRKDGSLFAPKGKDALVPLKQGDRIFNGAETQSLMSSGMIPRFSTGTGTDGGNSGSKKGLLGTLGDVLGNVWSYISDPGKAFSAVIDNVTGSFDNLSGFGGKLAQGAFGLVKDQGLDWLSGIFKDNEGALGTGKAGSFMGYRMTTPYSPNSPVPGYPTSFNNGHHYGVDYGTPIGTPVEAPMGGQLSSFWNAGGGKIAKLVTGQLRQFFMHMQTVAPSGSVQAGDIIGKTGNSGEWTTGPHIHWQAQQGADALNRNTVDPRKVVGHANGGIFRNRHIAEINEEGPEAIIPLSAKRRGRANSLYDSVGRQLGRDDNGRDQARVIDLLEKQNALLKERMGQPVYLDGKLVNDELATMDAVDSALRFN